ncbi:MAG: hypothetical protein ACE5JF_00135 [Anaerolineales bacterium]
MEEQIIDWLLEGDVSIQYQAWRDLLDQERPDLRGQIATEGWGARFLSLRNDNGHWGRAYYQPKWISTHYTILDLKNLGISPAVPAIHETLRDVLEHQKGPDGGINTSPTIKQSDVCLNGMFLNFAAYFEMSVESLQSIVDFILSEHMNDGGFNCDASRWGAVHSSLHSTLSILEGILEFTANGYSYRTPELLQVAAAAREFILQHRLYKSDRTGEIIDKRMLLLSYPARWYYDILRALDYFQCAGVEFDPRMQDALDVLIKKRRKDGKWPVQGKHPGQTHFEMELPREPSRWNTLRALRVLKHFDLMTRPGVR